MVAVVDIVAVVAAAVMVEVVEVLVEALEEEVVRDLGHETNLSAM
jgi:hypothetical protein